ncbi:LysM peptidoglycan-binding domain-containing protein [Peribacillus huizhouensis]|uniref:Type IV pilus assembly protein PilO n=1 Tax=Peribacillus huizhouensis TaxID=1501239 RepID=A0ABR6CLD7_9BACI|nr:LysM peptidoglycan-binding domain-containing protein [Peribacillus huizhouensis]MBA9025734.1 type IV pilus assembly protein PilO [Peribacillus huizhouensis]
MLSRKVLSFILTLLLLVFISAVCGAYFFEYKPLQEKISTHTQSIAKEKDELEKLDQKEKKSVSINTTALQKKLPVSELVDQFIIMLEEVEVASGTLITNLVFADSKQQGDSVDEFEAGHFEIAEEASNANSLPEGVKKLTAVITVESPTYLELESFVKGLEDLERHTKVESLQYTGIKEINRFMNTAETLTFNLTVSTYYYPKLEELKTQLPKYEEPKPANKINPLFETNLLQLPKKKVETEKETGADWKIVKRNQTTYKVYTYKVKPGDTLFQLAILYYNSRSGEKVIKDWNHLQQLEANTKIEIPVPADGKN